ncbi:hypothetical protein CPC16_001208 [Podila verticillata]|nr:hypothetical protein BGZ59_001780 [Podila verticillata]KAF9374592.1 hypothetical protein CPC16_001208 [Podila verticillata]KFH68690.1 hypothetical protein MVEG_05498 [Podila verticillata NRRL 6337]
MPAPAPGLQSISDLTTTSRITTGDIPPPLVGATMTIVDDKLYLFGGRLIQTRQMTNSLYILHLSEFRWENVTEVVNVVPTKPSIGDPGAEDEMEVSAPPAERYFHSANAYKNSIVYFGGMGPSATSSSASDAQDLIVFDDIKVLDLELLQWRQVRIPTSAHSPKPRYAHLSSISGSKLVVVGGQDIANQYIEEINVLDLDSWQWVASMPFEKHCGSYRSIAVSGSGQGSTIPQIGSEVDQASSGQLSPTSSDGFPTSYLRKASSNSSLHYTPSLRKSSSNLALKKGGPMSRLSGSSSTFGSSPPSENNRSSIYRLSHLMSPSPVQQQEHPIYLYSNFNFTDVKRELQVLNPPQFSTQDHSHSMSGSILPPGLRFPTGAIAGQHLLLSGTYLTNAQQTFSIWSLNLSSLVWTRIDTGTVFNSGSWNRGLLMEDSNAYLVFGNKSRNLADDYQNRQTNFEHVSIVDLEAFGIYQQPPTTMTQTAQELGLGLLNDPAMADFEILTNDNQRIPVNSAILSARWPYFGALLREQEEQDANDAALGVTAEGSDYDPTLFSKRTLTLPEPYTVVLAFLQYLYTDHLVTAQQHHSQVLSQLLLLADMYGLDRLRDLATHALHQMLNMSTAAMVYETAALSQQTGLQIRSLKVMIAAKKMLQQQQLKLQQQQAQSQSVSANQAWRSTEPIYGSDPQAYASNPYLSQQQHINGLFQPSPPPPGSPNGSEYRRMSITNNGSQPGLPHPMVKRGSLLGSMPPQHWNTEPLTPPPVSPPPPAVVPPQPTPAKTSFFSFPGSKSKAAAAAAAASSNASISSSSASIRSGSANIPAFAGMGVAPMPFGMQSDTSSIRSGMSGGSDEAKRAQDEKQRQDAMRRVMDGQFGGY